jgi:hypothetical protein
MLHIIVVYSSTQQSANTEASEICKHTAMLHIVLNWSIPQPVYPTKKHKTGNRWQEIIDTLSSISEANPRKNNQSYPQMGVSY